MSGAAASYSFPSPALGGVFVYVLVLLQGTPNSHKVFAPAEVKLNPFFFGML